MSIPRRAVLRAGSVALAGAGSVATAGRASAAESAVDAATPDSVSREYDEAVLERYRPKLVLRDLDDNRPNALYAFVARSEDFDGSVAVYWADYDFQQGVSPFAGTLSDSHFGDHEPIYVRFDEATGDVTDVAYSAYHWLRGWTATPPQSGRNPLFHVVKPWHHYYQTAEVGADIDLKNLSDAELQSWLDNGWDESIYLRAVTIPWLMMGASGRPHWWAESFVGVSTQAILSRYVAPIILGVNDNVDIEL